MDFDPDHNDTVPWNLGTVGLTAKSAVYDGNTNKIAIFLDRSDALKSKINVVPEMNDVMGLAPYF